MYISAIDTPFVNISPPVTLVNFIDLLVSNTVSAVTVSIFKILTSTTISTIKLQLEFDTNNSLILVEVSYCPDHTAVVRPCPFFELSMFRAR